MPRNVLHKINSLNPDTAHWEIIRLSSMYEFPWDYNRALELALFRTFASPSISKILHSSRQFEKYPQKRYDDTDMILSEILENGLDSERGRKTIERLNFIHSHFNISNEDYLYVLSTFVFEPKRWIDKYGYRQLTDNERKAGYKVWQEIGAAMHIQNIPATVAELEQFNMEYEKRNFHFTKENHEVATATVNMLLGWYLPRFLFPVAKPFLYAVMDKPLLDAVGFKEPNFLVRFLVRMFFDLRKIIVSILPERKKPLLRTQLPNKTYPVGYAIDELGPEQFRKNS
jgi:hypothetical protein